MRLSRIYLDADLSASAIKLSKPSLHYLRKVLRLSDGDQLRIFDGCGSERMARLDGISAILGNVVEPPPPATVEITLLQAISRGERMDQTIQKATELGVSRIVPLLSEHCEVRLSGDRAQKRLAHWQGVARSACEQCGRADLPRLDPIVSLSGWLAQTADSLATAAANTSILRLMLVPTGEQHLGQFEASNRIVLAVGCEGGFSDAEERGLSGTQFKPVRLGQRVLRTETAGPAAIAAIQALWGDFSV